MSHQGLSEAGRKVKLSLELFTMAYQIKRHQLKVKYPELSKKELDRLTRESFPD